MKLNKEQITSFDYLIASAFIKIRAISRTDDLSPKEKKEQIDSIANGFHNLPWMIAEEEVDAEKVLSDLSIAGKSFHDRGREILFR